MFRKIRIRQYERGLLFRHGEYKQMLAPGAYRLWSRLWSLTRTTIDVVSTLETRLEHVMLEPILNSGDASLLELLEVLNLTDNQRAIIWRDGRFYAIVGPGQHAFWKSPYKLVIEVFDVDSLRFTHAKLESILQQSQAKAYLEVVEIDPHVEALLLVNGQLNQRLSAGKHVFWKSAARVRIVPVDRREQTADVAGQEIMTSDKVTLRVNLLVTYQVTDAVKAVTTVSDYSQSLYREAQLVLRAAVGTRALDALLADKESIGSEVLKALASRANEFGVTVRSVGLKDIILPGDMKTILNQVIEAQKAAEANLIRRREETAAARSQANTAKVLAENPVLARLKELEMLQSIVSGAKSTFVFGSGDMLDNLRGLISQNVDKN